MKAWEIMETKKELFDPLFAFVTSISDDVVVFEIPGNIWDSISIETDKIQFLLTMFESVEYTRLLREDFLDMRIPMNQKVGIVHLYLKNPKVKNQSNSQKQLNDANE